MGTRVRAVLSVGAIAVCVGLAASACSSGSTAGVETASSSASASPAFPVESLPPGVQKDSVEDLNSTKDMTGVVTTVPFGESPYAAHLPDVCQFIPNSVSTKFGMSVKRKAFRGTQLVVQTCDMQQLSPEGEVQSSITVSYYINTIQDILNPSKAEVVTPQVQLTDKVVGTVNRSIPSSPDDATSLESCGTAWGTFFGAILVIFRYFDQQNPSACEKSVEAARLIAPAAPRSPSQMRPS